MEEEAAGRECCICYEDEGADGGGLSRLCERCPALIHDSCYAKLIQHQHEHCPLCRAALPRGGGGQEGQQQQPQQQQQQQAQQQTQSELRQLETRRLRVEELQRQQEQAQLRALQRRQQELERLQQIREQSLREMWEQRQRDALAWTSLSVDPVRLEQRARRVEAQRGQLDEQQHAQHGAHQERGVRSDFPHFQGGRQQPQQQNLHHLQQPQQQQPRRTVKGGKRSSSRKLNVVVLALRALLLSLFAWMVFHYLRARGDGGGAEMAERIWSA